jgi:hypothetical protein
VASIVLSGPPSGRVTMDLIAHVFGQLNKQLTVRAFNLSGSEGRRLVLSTRPGVFLFFDAHRSWRRVKVTRHRTADDFAFCMCELVVVEIKIGVLKGQCLDRPIGSCDRLVAEINAWQTQRNRTGTRITSMFSTDKARTEMPRACPNPSPKEP